MPLYTYQCLCGLRFEANGRMSNHSEPCECPDCKNMAERVVSDSVEGVFNQGISGPVPQNTGISSLDNHIDRVIGQSAEQGRKAHVDRVEVKKELLRDNPDATGHDITRTPDGNFAIMSKEERKARDTALSVNNQAMKIIQQDRVKSNPDLHQGNG